MHVYIETSHCLFPINDILLGGKTDTYALLPGGEGVAATPCQIPVAFMGLSTAETSLYLYLRGC